MYYEVFIPSPDPDGFDVTITVDAENWMSALKSGLERTGEGADAVRNVMCDIKDDNSIHVTDASTQRVFVLREVSKEETPQGERTSDDAARDTAQADAPAEATVSGEVQEDAASTAATQRIDISQRDMQPEPAQPAEPAAKQQTQVEPPEKEDQPELQDQQDQQGLGDEHSWTDDGGRMRIGSSSQEALKREDSKARIVNETRSKTDQKKAVEIGRRNEKVSESLIEDIFLEIQEIHEGDKPMEDVVNFVMDMAMEKVGAESGSVLFADVNGRELYFATARGPKADEIMDYRVPMGKGIVGFCTREGVSLAISDAPNDPRFYKEISEALGYETQGLVCAPIQHEARVYGALELINKKSGTGFTADEMNALSYMGRQLAQFVHDTIMRREELE